MEETSRKMDNDVSFDIAYYLINEKYGTVCYRKGERKIILLELQDQYIKQIIPDYPNMVCTQMRFDGDTLQLQDKGQYLKHGGVGIGIWEYYNDEGELNHTVNTDEHFPITWEKLEQILKDKDISLLTADSIYRYYDEEKDTATWSIVIKLPLDKGCLYVFDARTGKLIKEEIIDMRKEL